MYQTELGIPRHGASPREVARAGEIWRLFQEVAMRATTAAGWPPDRYRAIGTSFVIYGMTGVHHREVAFGQRLRAKTWVHDFKRGTLTKRQIRLSDAQGPVAACTQQWVHTDASLRPVRASADLLASFAPEHPDLPPVSLPDAVRFQAPGREHGFDFDIWYTWMDPLDHVNHPAYVDFCDESTARALAAAGLDPQALVPVAERVVFKAGARAGKRVQVRSRLVGRTPDGAAVLEHELGGRGALARATTVRRHLHADLCEVLA